MLKEQDSKKPKRKIQFSFSTEPASLSFKNSEEDNLKPISILVSLLPVDVDKAYITVHLHDTKIREKLRLGVATMMSDAYLDTLMMDAIIPIHIDDIVKSTCLEEGECECVTEVETKIFWNTLMFGKEKGAIEMIQIKYTNKATKEGKEGTEAHRCGGNIEEPGKIGGEEYIKRHRIQLGEKFSDTPSRSDRISKKYFREGLVIFYTDLDLESYEPYPRECFRYK